MKFSIGDRIRTASGCKFTITGFYKGYGGPCAYVRSDGVQLGSVCLNGAKRLVPRKSPPSPPEGWEYSAGSHKYDIERISKYDGYTCVAGISYPEADRAVADAAIPPDELVAVAKFLRRLARWHARRTK